MVRTPAHPRAAWPKEWVHKPASHRDPYDAAYGYSTAKWFSKIFRHPHLGKAQIGRLRAVLSFFKARGVGGQNCLNDKQWMWRERATRAVREFDNKQRLKVRLATRKKTKQATQAELRVASAGRTKQSLKHGGDRRSTKFLHKSATAARVQREDDAATCS